MKKTDVAVVGGSAAGLTAAITVRRHYPDKKVLVIRKEKEVPIPCGIPYIFGTVGDPCKNLIPDAALDKNSLELLIAEAKEIDRESRVLKTSEEDVAYERLIIATGSQPVRPGIPGIDLKGVYTILKDVDYLSGLQQSVKGARDVVIIGGGFIGIEFADEIKKSGVANVTVVEIAEHCLSLAYDDEFCSAMEDYLKDRGLNIVTGTRVVSVNGSDGVKSVSLEDGRELKADVVILGVGAAANGDLAAAAGLDVGDRGEVMVDRAMRTSDQNIFACGDCAVKVSFFSGKPSGLKLASIATLEARIAGANVFGIKRESVGTIGVWSTAVGDLAIGAAGLTERAANEEGYVTVAATVEGPNRHPGGMPGMANSRMKLLFEKSSLALIGGEVMGDSSAGEIINILSACIQNKMTADDIATFQTGTHPALTASPIAYPIVNAAEIAIGNAAKPA